MQKLVFRNANGIELDLTSDPFGITEWEGFSADDLNIQTQQVPFQDGGVYLDALLQERTLSVVVAMNDKNDLEARYSLRREMISKLNPKLGEGVLIYTNDYLSKQIHVVPQLPVFQNHNSNDSGTPKAECSFVACNPYWEDLEDSVVSFKIGQQPNVTNEGDIPAQIKMEWLTNSVTNPKVTNVTQNQKIKYNGTLNESLQINTNIGEKSVISETLATGVIQVGQGFGKIRCIGETTFIFSNNSSYKRVNGELQQLQFEDGIIPRDITYSTSLGMYVLVCSDGKIFTSTDTENWTERTSGTSRQLTAICFSSELSLFVAVGDFKTILTSPDGTTWTSRTSEDTIFLVSVAYSETAHCFVTGGGTRLLRSENGTSWEQVTISYGLQEVITDADGNFYAVGTGGTIVKSSDGTTWTQKTSGTNLDLSSIAYSKEIGFVAIGQTIMLFSTNGESWTNKEVEDWYLNSVAFDSETSSYLATGENGLLIESYNGEDWSTIKQGADNYQECCAYSKILDVFVIGGDDGFSICKNGKDWKFTEWDFERDFEMYGLCYSEKLGLFVGVGESRKVVTSTDGEHWELNDLDGGGYFYDVIYSEEKELFIAVGGGFIYKSLNGYDWQLVADELETTLNAVTYADGKFVAVGNGLVAYSTDGTTWNSVVVNGYNMTGVTYSIANALFVAVTDSGELIKIQSADLTSWLVSEITTESLRCIRYFNNYGIYIATGDNETILTSFDGLNYTELFAGSNIRLTDVAYYPNIDSFVLVGGSGTIFSLSFKEGENKIQNLSLDSDIGMNLAVGDNQFRINKDEGNLIVRIAYRQKYVGV